MQKRQTPGSQQDSASNQTAATGRQATEAMHPDANRMEVAVDARPTTRSMPRGNGALTANVRVVDGETRAAVPFAKVAVMTKMFTWAAMSDADRYRVRRFGDDAFGLYDSFGTTYQADEEGRLMLRIEKDLFLACRHQGAIGSMSLHAQTVGEAEVHELRLFASVDIGVRVVGADGKPVAGVPIRVQLHWANPEHEKQFSQRGGNLGAHSLTGEDGTATLRNLIAATTRFGEQERPDRFGIALDIVGRDPRAARCRVCASSEGDSPTPGPGDRRRRRPVARRPWRAARQLRELLHPSRARRSRRVRIERATGGSWCGAFPVRGTEPDRARVGLPFHRVRTQDRPRSRASR